MPNIDVRDEREPGHFWADNEVYDHFGKRIGPMGLAVYMGLCRYAKAGVSFPSIPRLAADLGIKSEQTVRKALAKLEEVELIRVERRPAEPEAKRGTQTHRYFLLKVEKDKREVKDVQGEGALNVPPPALDVPGGVQISTPNKTYLNKTDLTSGGETRELAKQPAAAFDPQIANRLMAECGFGPGQAKRACIQQPIDDALVDRLAELSKRLKSQGKVPAKIICPYTDIGKLPEDLPKSKQADDDFYVRGPDGQINWPATSERVRNNQALMTARR